MKTPTPKNSAETAPSRKNIAVIGSGISGLSCAWLLSKSQNVTLFEKDDRLGGHSNTVTFDLDKRAISVDTGFIVYNPINYPNLVKFFEQLGVTTCDTDMSFSVSVNGGELEYSGSGLSGLLAQKRNLFRPAFWGMVADLLRFYRQSPKLLQAAELEQLSLGELLAKHRYGKSFINNHLLPMGAAIWSVPVDKMLNYPALSFMRFCSNHGLTQVNNRPQWRTVVGGSRQYVDKIAAALQGSIRLNTRIQSVTRLGGQVALDDIHGNREIFDDVVFACHSDQALALLADPTTEEQSLLSCFPYQRNRAFLHLDTDLMPKRQQVWSSWNYLTSNKPGSKNEQLVSDQKRKVSVTYWMNQLQPLATEQPVMVSLNPLKMPRSGTIIRSFFYDHPTFDQSSLAAQKQLWSLQGKQHTWFCGAYFGYGFHEDGLQSGLAVAEALGGVVRPWQLEEPNSRIEIHTGSLPDSAVELYCV